MNQVPLLKSNACFLIYWKTGGRFSGKYFHAHVGSEYQPYFARYTIEVLRGSESENAK